MAPLAPVPKVPLEDTHINRRPGVADPRDIGTSRAAAPVPYRRFAGAPQQGKRSLTRHSLYSAGGRARVPATVERNSGAVPSENSPCDQGPWNVRP
jgi:hypothetical protein